MIYERIVDGVVETPIVHYAHVRTRSEVSVVGMLHLAQPSYFHSISTFAAARYSAGAAVHYEGIKRSTLTDAEGPQVQVDARVSSLTRRHRLLGWLSGLAFQNDVMAYEPGWENHDTNDSEITQRIGTSGPDADRVLHAIVDLASRMPRPGRAPRWMAAAVRRAVVVHDAEEWVAEPVMQRDEVIVGYRNGLQLSAVERVNRQDPDRDIVMLWGLEHVSGLGAGLEDLGYARDSESWIPAFPLRP